MKTVHKYLLQRDPEPLVVEMPAGAELLCVQMQYGWPTLWALVDTSAEKVQRTIVNNVTGGEVDANGKYIGTLQFDDGVFVLHFFDLGEVRR